MNGGVGLPLMGVPLGAAHPPGGCPQLPRQVVRNDRPVTATPGKGATKLTVEMIETGVGQVAEYRERRWRAAPA